MKKKLTYLLVFSLFMMLGCGKEQKKEPTEKQTGKQDVEWEGPDTVNLPDGVIAIEADGDTIWMEDLEQTVDSLEYYMGKYFEEQDEN